MRVYILGAGASAHAGYPLASRLGTGLASWVETLPAKHHYRERIMQLRTLYGTLDDFETLLTDLFTCPRGSPARSLPAGVLPNLLSDIEEAIREYTAVREMSSERPLTI